MTQDLPHNQFQTIKFQIHDLGFGQMLKIPSPVFDKKLVKFMNWDKRKKKLPSVLSSVLSKKKGGAIRVAGPVPTAKLVGTMV